MLSRILAPLHIMKCSLKHFDKSIAEGFGSFSAMCIQALIVKLWILQNFLCFSQNFWKRKTACYRYVEGNFHASSVPVFMTPVLKPSSTQNPGEETPLSHPLLTSFIANRIPCVSSGQGTVLSHSSLLHDIWRFTSLCSGAWVSKRIIVSWALRPLFLPVTKANLNKCY